MCMHVEIVVDYLHPFGELARVPVTELQRMPSPRPVMTLVHPRCAACGLAFTPRELGARIARGGDLYSPQFSWTRR